MFRLSLIVLLMITLFFQTMNRGIIVLSYLTNTEIYQENCVNKAKPEMHCQGKCQMNKKIKEQEEKEQKDPLKNFKYSEVCMVSPETVLSQPYEIWIAVSKESVPLSIGNICDYSTSLFHPPDQA